MSTAPQSAFAEAADAELAAAGDAAAATTSRARLLLASLVGVACGVMAAGGAVAARNEGDPAILEMIDEMSSEERIEVRRNLARLEASENRVDLLELERSIASGRANERAAAEAYAAWERTLSPEVQYGLRQLEGEAKLRKVRELLADEPADVGGDDSQPFVLVDDDFEELVRLLLDEADVPASDDDVLASSPFLMGVRAISALLGDDAGELSRDEFIERLGERTEPIGDEIFRLMLRSPDRLPGRIENLLRFVVERGGESTRRPERADPPRGPGGPGGGGGPGGPDRRRDGGPPRPFAGGRGGLPDWRAVNANLRVMIVLRSVTDRMPDFARQRRVRPEALRDLLDRLPESERGTLLELDPAGFRRALILKVIRETYLDPNGIAVELPTLFAASEEVSDRLLPRVEQLNRAFGR